MKVAAITKFKHGALFQLLNELGWSQREFAIRSKMPYTTMNQIFNLTRRPNEQQIIAMERAFGNVDRFVNVAEFFPDSYIGFKRPLTVVQIEDVSPAQLEDFRRHQTRLLQDAQPPIPSDLVDSEDKLQQVIRLLDGTSGSLSERERDVVQSVFFKHETCKEIGKRYGVTSTSINANFHRALSKIRNYFERKPKSGIEAVITGTAADHITTWKDVEENRRAAEDDHERNKRWREGRFLLRSPLFLKTNQEREK